MRELQKAAPHLLTATVAIIAFTLLALDHVITGGEAYGGILAASGFTLGGTVASGSISTAATAAVDVSHSASAQAVNRSLTQSTQSPTNAPTPQNVADLHS